MRGKKPTRGGRGKGKKFITPPVEESDDSQQQQPEQSQQPASDSEDSEIVGPSQAHHVSESEVSESDNDSQPIQQAASGPASAPAIQPASQPPPIQPASQPPPSQVQGAIETLGGAAKCKEPRKKRAPVTISEEQETAAVEFLKRHPLLYD